MVLKERVSIEIHYESIDRSLDYAKSLVGVGRGNTLDHEYLCGSDTGPYWAADGPVKPYETIKQGGINCTGLINLIRRYLGLSVTVVNPNDLTRLGDTDEWFTYLNHTYRLKPFEIDKSYPKGTLLLRNYNEIDQGHLAVIYQENKEGVLFSKLIHSVGWSDGSNLKCIKIDECVGKSYFCQYNGTTNTGHYTHICLPEDWLIKN